MDWQVLIPEPLLGFILHLGLYLPLLRLILYGIRRALKKPDNLFAFIARQMDLEWTNMMLLVENETLKARLKNMQKNVEESQLRQNYQLDDSPDSSIDYLGETLKPKRRNTDKS